VPTVDVTAGTVTLTPPPGLFEELPDEPDAREPEPDRS
jgi:16S rRNA processing protein RimM